MKHCFMKTERLASRATQLNALLEKLMPFLPPVGVALGFAFSERLIVLKPAVPWLFALMTLSGALKLRARELGAAAARPVPVVAFLVGSHVLMPLIALGAAALFLPGQTDLIAGFVLLFSTPTAVSAFIWVAMFYGDNALSLAIILLDSLIAPAVVPFTVSLLLGTSVAVDSAGMVASLFAMVVAPTVLGVALNESSRGRIPAKIGPFIGPFSKFCLLFVFAGNAAAIAPRVDLLSPTVWLVSALCILLAVVGFSLGRVFGFLPGLDAATRRSLTFNIGFRNTNAAATIAIAFFPEAAALPATLGVIFQQSLAAIMGRVLLGPPGKGREEPATTAAPAAEIGRKRK
jgi:BASS family bile acid:Na+ symporter